MFLNARFGCVESQTCIGVAGTNTIERFYDAFGRDAGYALNGVRQSTLSYDAATGRLVTMQAFPEEANHHSSTSTSHFNSFRWNYLPGSDLKQSLTYPNGLTASWTYGNRGELLQVCNARTVSSSPSMTSNYLEVVSQYAYTYDAAGRRIACAKSGTAFENPDTYYHFYNHRGELTNTFAAAELVHRYCYKFDDIGNRKTSFERGTEMSYSANQLNQYTSIDTTTVSHATCYLSPSYDADGNQTIVKTATGIWNVTYNGENRPVRWTQGDTVITMSFDRMGRRVTKNAQRFVYNGYLQIADNCGNTYVWDCTENVATRPFAWKRGTSVAYYTHDGNKNVSEVIASNTDVAAHYEYAPFGALTISRGVSAADNPWRFSSEYAEDDTATVYYNYRHYEPVTGRWMSRDPIEEEGGINLYCAVDNALQIDELGLVNYDLLFKGFLQAVGGMLTVGGLILANAGGAAAAPFSGGATAAVVAALDVAVVGWASMNIANGLSQMGWALADADSTEPAQITIARGIVETVSGSPMSQDGIKSLTIGFHTIDAIASAYTFACGVWSERLVMFKYERVWRDCGLAVATGAQHVKFVYSASSCAGAAVSGALDAWFYYSALKSAVEVKTATDYERQRSSGK